MCELCHSLVQVAPKPRRLVRSQRLEKQRHGPAAEKSTVECKHTEKWSLDSDESLDKSSAV